MQGKWLDQATDDDLIAVAMKEPSQWMQNYAPGMAASIRIDAEAARKVLAQRHALIDV